MRMNVSEVRARGRKIHTVFVRPAAQRGTPDEPEQRVEDHSEDKKKTGLTNRFEEFLERCFANNDIHTGGFGLNV